MDAGTGGGRRTLHPYGATLRVTADPPELLRAFDHAIAHMPADAGGAGVFDVTITTHRDAGTDPAWPTVTIDDTPQRLVVRCGSGLLRVDHAAATAVIDLPDSMAASGDAVRCLAEGALSSLLIRSGRLHAVHSGLVVSLDGTGVLLRGESGAGKSTLTYACLRSGFAVASDDWVYGIPGADPAMLHGYPWRLFLMPDTRRFFPELADVAAVPHPSVDRWKLPIEPAPDAQRVSARVDAVVFLSAATDGTVDRIGTDEAADRWWRSALPTERSDLPPDWVRGLLDRPCFVVARREHPGDVAAMLAQLVTTLR